MNGNKSDVVKAMEDKRRGALKEVVWYDRGLEKIKQIELGALYEVSVEGSVSTGGRYGTLIRCMELGRDRMLGRVLASEVELSVSDACTKGYWWGDTWTVKPVLLEELPCYVSWKFKTKWWDKALKGDSIGKCLVGVGKVARRHGIRSIGGGV